MRNHDYEAQREAAADRRLSSDHEWWTEWDMQRRQERLELERQQQAQGEKDEPTTA